MKLIQQLTITTLTLLLLSACATTSNQEAPIQGGAIAPQHGGAVAAHTAATMISPLTH